MLSRKVLLGVISIALFTSSSAYAYRSEGELVIIDCQYDKDDESVIFTIELNVLFHESDSKTFDRPYLNADDLQINVLEYLISDNDLNTNKPHDRNIALEYSPKIIASGDSAEPIKRIYFIIDHSISLSERELNEIHDFMIICNDSDEIGKYIIDAKLFPGKRIPDSHLLPLIKGSDLKKKAHELDNSTNKKKKSPILETIESALDKKNNRILNDSGLVILTDGRDSEIKDEPNQIETSKRIRMLSDEKNIPLFIVIFDYEDDRDKWALDCKIDDFAWEIMTSGSGEVYSISGNISDKNGYDEAEGTISDIVKNIEKKRSKDGVYLFSYKKKRPKNAEETTYSYSVNLELGGDTKYRLEDFKIKGSGAETEIEVPTELNSIVIIYAGVCVLISFVCAWISIYKNFKDYHNN